MPIAIGQVVMGTVDPLSPDVPMVGLGHGLTLTLGNRIRITGNSATYDHDVGRMYDIGTRQYLTTAQGIRTVDVAIPIDRANVGDLVEKLP